MGMVDLRERTTVFAVRVLRMSDSMPRTIQGETLSRQVVRSATSVGANFREAFRARSRSEYIAKLGICLMELEETHYWLTLINQSSYFPLERIAPLLQETHELLALLTTITKKAKARSKP